MKNVLVVGSSVVDLFMSVDADHYQVLDKKIQLELGDKVPSHIKSFATGGNGANVSVGLVRLEIPATFYTYLGKDILSREIEERLSSEGVELAADRHGGGAPLHIIIDFDNDRIIFSHYEPHEHAFTYDSPPQFAYIYLTSLADVWEGAYEQVLEYSQKNNLPIAFSPGSRQLEDRGDLFKRTISATKLFFSNKHEAEMILGKQDMNPAQILQEIKGMGPQIVSITDGGNGAYTLGEDGKMFQIDTLHLQPVESTGAGDAYSTGFLAGLLEGRPIEDCMRWGVFNASGVMQKVGAQAGLLTKKEMEEWETRYSTLIAKPLL